MSVDVFEVDKSKHVLDEEGLRSSYSRDGVVAIRGLFSAEEAGAVVAEFAATMATGLQTLDRHVPEDPDEIYRALWQADEAKARVCMGLGRDIPGYIHLISDPRLRAVITTLLGDRRLMLAFDHCLFRIDGQETATNSFGWHQDYPYNVLSADAVTFWIPLRPIDSEMGPVRIVPGSHDRIRSVRPSDEVRHFDPNRLVLVDEAEEGAQWEEQSVGLPDLDPGDVVLFDSRLVHRSDRNRSPRFRWVANGRYGRIADPALVARNWYTARTKYPHFFADAHPELAQGFE